MKPINITKLTEAGKSKLEQKLNEVQARSQVRTISMSNFTMLSERLNNFLSIPKKHMDGMGVKIDFNAQDFPKAYKYMPQSTIVWCENIKGNWYIRGIERGECKRVRLTWFNVPDEAKEAIVNLHLGRYFS